jgi:hypothetical protein
MVVPRQQRLVARLVRCSMQEICCSCEDAVSVHRGHRRITSGEMEFSGAIVCSCCATTVLASQRDDRGDKVCNTSSGAAMDASLARQVLRNGTGSSGSGCRVDWAVPLSSTRDYSTLQRRLLPHAQTCSSQIVKSEAVWCGRAEGGNDGDVAEGKE